MKITDVKVWCVEGTAYNWVMLKIYTDSGFTGVGESTNWPGSPMIYHATQFMAKQIIGMDPLQTDFIFTKLFRDYNWTGPYGVTLCAISGIDMALYDLKAKYLNVPLYEILGGAFRKRIRLYANYWFNDIENTPESYARRAKQVVEKGFLGVKYDPFSHTSYTNSQFSLTSALSENEKLRAVETVKQVREAIGNDCDMMIETHALLDYSTALEMAERLKPYRITWYEEPVGPENFNSLQHIREKIDPAIPICVGERHYTRYGIREILEKHVCEYIMPDITRCGGVGELKKMSNLAEIYNVSIAPHNPNGPLSTLASAHVCASIPNFFRQEFIYNDVLWRDEIITHGIDIQDGYLILSDRPGLGVDLVEEEMLKHPGIFDEMDKPTDRTFYI